MAARLPSSGTTPWSSWWRAADTTTPPAVVSNGSAGFLQMMIPVRPDVRVVPVFWKRTDEAPGSLLTSADVPFALRLHSRSRDWSGHRRPTSILLRPESEVGPVLEADRTRHESHCPIPEPCFRRNGPSVRTSLKAPATTLRLEAAERAGVRALVRATNDPGCAGLIEFAELSSQARRRRTQCAAPESV